MRSPRVAYWLILGGWLAAAAVAAPVSQLEVRVTTGQRELIAGSSLELKIYEAGKPPRTFPLVHGESWAAGSTHLVALKLTDPLDLRDVLRFGLSYRNPVPAAGEIEIAAAEVEIPDAALPRRLLDTRLSGVIQRQGELDTEERDLAAIACRADADCDDHRMCNGVERCAPRAPGADARGCVKGAPVVCPVNQVCSESSGCRGIGGTSKP